MKGARPPGDTLEKRRQKNAHSFNISIVFPSQGFLLRTGRQISPRSLPSLFIVLSSRVTNHERRGGRVCYCCTTAKARQGGRTCLIIFLLFLPWKMDKKRGFASFVVTEHLVNKKSCIGKYLLSRKIFVNDDATTKKQTHFEEFRCGRSFCDRQQLYTSSATCHFEPFRVEGGRD